MSHKTVDEKNIMLNNLNGIFQIIAVNLVSSFAGLFIKRLKASDELVSLFNSLPAFFSVAAILLGTTFIMSRRNKKKATSTAFIITRSFYLLMALVPLLSEKYRALVFVFLYSALNFTGSIANFSWQSLLADIFSPTLRAKALSVRNSLASFAGTLTTLTAGFILNRLSSSNEKLIHFYQFFFVLAFIFGIFEVATLVMHRENPDDSFKEVVTDARISLKFLKVMINQKSYVFFMIAVIVFHFAWQMAWPLFLTYEVDYLHTNEMWSALISTVNGIFMVFGYTFWRKVSEKRGSAIPLTICALGTCLNPLLYAFITSIQQVLYFVGIVGFLYSGVFLILINKLYEVAPQENRTSYIAFYNLVTNITLIAAPWVGMELYKVTDIKTAFLIIGGLRIAAAFLFLIKPKKSAQIEAHI